MSESKLNRGKVPVPSKDGKERHEKILKFIKEWQDKVYVKKSSKKESSRQVLRRMERLKLKRLASQERKFVIKTRLDKKVK